MRNIRKTAPLTVMLLAATVLLAGCGKGPDQAPAPAPAEPADTMEPGGTADMSIAPSAASSETPSSEPAAAGGAKPQTLCPVMGMAIDRSAFVDYKGKRIYFCCQNCPGVFRKDPEKYMSKMKAEGIQLEDSPK